MDPSNDDIPDLIANYTPASLSGPQWTAVATTVRTWVTAVAPTHPRRARQLLAAGAQLAAWCLEHNIPLDTDTALRTTTIERYCAAAQSDGRHAATSRSTIRARLRCLAQAQHISGQPPPPARLGRGRIKPPYSREEVARYFTLVSAQPDLIAQRLEALLLAGLGAGCGSEELRDLRGTDVVPGDDGAVLVHLRGRCDRAVPVVARYADRLAALAAECGDALLIGGEKPGRRAVASRLLQRLKTEDELPTLEPGRLRSTWIADRLVAGTRIDVLMHAAGLTTPTTIVDLASSLAPLPTPQAWAQLRADGPCPPPVQQTHNLDPGSRIGCPHNRPIDGRGA